MEQYEINEVFEAFLKVLDSANAYEVHYFNCHISVEDAKGILELRQRAKDYLETHPAKKPLKLKKRG